MPFDASNLVPCTHMSGRSLQLVYLFQEVRGAEGLQCLNLRGATKTRWKPSHRRRVSSSNERRELRHAFRSIFRREEPDWGFLRVAVAVRAMDLPFRDMGLSENSGTLFWGPYNLYPTI